MTPPVRAPFSGRRMAEVVVLAAAAWLAWRIVESVLIPFAPLPYAARIAPNSPTVALRVAEGALAAHRPQDAEILAREALSRAPFNARGMRILALAWDEQGRADQALEAMTLAGNWTLRDTPAHAWLVDRLLRRGDYAASFAHASTLLLRRQPGEENIYRLFTEAARHDARARGVLLALLPEALPWRQGYLTWLQKEEQGDELLALIATGLKDGPAPLTDQELEILYTGWIAEGRIGAMRVVRTALGRPSDDHLIADGDFTEKDLIAPFFWTLRMGPGLNVYRQEDDRVPGRMTLRVEYDGRSSQPVAYQPLLLSPGSYALKGWRRSEVGDMRLDWRLVCVENGQVVSADTAAEAAGPEWAAFTLDIDIPAAGCTAQWLQLVPRPAQFREMSVTGFADLAITEATRP